MEIKKPLDQIIKEELEKLKKNFGEEEACVRVEIQGVIKESYPESKLHITYSINKKEVMVCLGVERSELKEKTPNKIAYDYLKSVAEFLSKENPIEFFENPHKWIIFSYKRGPG